MTFNRRDFIRLGAGASAALTTGVVGFPSISRAAGKRVVVVGGGVGGGTAAKYLRKFDPSLEVTLVEPSKSYLTCFFSNLVVGGLRDLKSLEFGYDGLAKRGVKVVHAAATAIDPTAKKVALEGGQTLEYDFCVVSPGIELKYDGIAGYSEEISQKLPHAWKAGPQTNLLRLQLDAMDDGGVVIISAPADPFRCPPGPYERAGLIAHYLKQKKPKSKVLILDAKDAFAKQGLFLAGWKELYGDMIEWVPASKEGKVTKVDAAAMTVTAGNLDSDHKGNVINVIPPQTAGKIAIVSGLANDKGWCPVNPMTFESTLHKNVYVIGDACIAAPMPKSAYAANAQAKVCAAAIAHAAAGSTPPSPVLFNTCYSYLAPDDAISVGAIYKIEEGKLAAVKGAGGVTPAKATKVMRAREAEFAVSWYVNVTDDIFG